MKSNKTPNSSKPKFGRRTYIVDRRFQIKYTLMLMIGGAVISILFGVIAYLVAADVQQNLTHEVARFGSRGLDQTAIDRLLKESTTTLLVLTVGITVLMTLALALLGVLITHRVAGPVHVMSNYVEALANGRYPLVRPLRKGDELKVFFERFQHALESLRRREEADAVAIQDALVKLKPAASSPEAQTALATLSAVCERKLVATGGADLGTARV
jgi:nitrogen fixation/metabolism regulation signal transduction histidine kinase